MSPHRVEAPSWGRPEHVGPVRGRADDKELAREGNQRDVAAELFLRFLVFGDFCAVGALRELVLLLFAVAWVSLAVAAAVSPARVLSLRSAGGLAA